MKKDIVFVSNNPGGVNSILPVIKDIQNRNIFKWEHYTSEFGTTVSSKSRLKYKKINYDLSDTEIDHILDKLQPRIVVTGTSLTQYDDGIFELRFISRAKKKHIPTLSIIDHWVHFKNRFKIKKKYVFPDTICVIDKKAKETAVMEGVKKEIIEISGNPYFDKLEKIKLNKKSSAYFLNKYGIVPSKKNILFISEPVFEDHGTKRGYDQYSVLKDVLKAVMSDGNKKLKIYLKLHPREKKFEFEFTTYPEIEFEFVDPSEIFEFAAGCNLVIGMTSILLVEMNLMGLPVVAYQPVKKKEHIVYMGGNIKIIINLLRLRKALKEKQSVNLKPFAINATENVIRIITKKLKENIL